MFQLFLRARTNNYLKERLGNEGFRARSAERDAETDRLRVGSILALQLRFWKMSESMGNHDSEVVDASSVD
jgi:hypothetical protein